jgi:hypothetical protein
MLQFAQSDSRIISSLCDCNYLSTEAVPFDITEIIPAESETGIIYLRRDGDKRNMNVAIFWDIASCSAYVSRRFGGTYDLRLQGGKSAEQETSVQQEAPKRLFTDGLYGAISQKMAIFITTAVITSNSTREICFRMF